MDYIKNRTTKKHPEAIIAACRALGFPLPSTASVDRCPSEYIGDKFSVLKINTYVLRRILGKNVKKYSDDTLIELFNLFKNKYEGSKKITHTQTDLIVYFTDWLLFAKDRGFIVDDYFNYELYIKDEESRESFISTDTRFEIMFATSNRFGRNFMNDKALFYAMFADYVHREWIDVPNKTFKEFEDFISRHKILFAKPIRGTGGSNARIIDISEYTKGELFELSIYEELSLEEIVKQHKDIAMFNPSTVNTVRVLTLLDEDNVAHITLAAARFGRAGKSVDNFHQGGVCALIDPDTGVVFSDFIDGNNEISSVHPDSKIIAKGFKYPCWDKVKDAVCASAEKIPELRHIGWDVVVTDNEQIEFIEGNCGPNFDVMQTPTQCGSATEYKKLLKGLDNFNIIFNTSKPDYAVYKNHNRAFILRYKLKKCIPKKLKKMVKKND